MSAPHLRLVVDHEPEPKRTCPIPDNTTWARWAAEDAIALRMAWTVVDMDESALRKFRYETPEAYARLCDELAVAADVHRRHARLAEAALAVLGDA